MNTRSIMHLGALGAALLALGPAGCSAYRNYYPGGGYNSLDRFTYESTSWMPQTVTLRDTRTGEDIWSMDVPVGQKVVVWFKRGEGPGQPYPDAMEWGLFDFDVNSGRLPNRLGVPGSDARLLVTALRPAPEMPGQMLAPSEYVEPAPMPGEPEQPAPDEPPAENGEPASLTPEEAGEDG